MPVDGSTLFTVLVKKHLLRLRNIVVSYRKLASNGF